MVQSSNEQTSPAGRNIQFIGPPAASGAPAANFAAMQDMFPCVPYEVRYQLARAAYPGASPSAYPSFYFQQPAWGWAECHAGSWLYRNNRYVWVVGRRHHHPPCHWVKSGRTVAYIPVHPHDVKDHAPVNRLNAIFAINDKNGHLVEPIKLETNHPLALLNDPPKDLRTLTPIPLPHASEPRMQAFRLKDFATAKGTPIKPVGIPITYSAKAQSFMMPHQTIQGGRPVSVVAPISNRGGDLQAHAGFSGGYHGGASGGSFHGGGSSGGSSMEAAAALHPGVELSRWRRRQFRRLELQRQFRRVQRRSQRWRRWFAPLSRTTAEGLSSPLPTPRNNENPKRRPLRLCGTAFVFSYL